MRYQVALLLVIAGFSTAMAEDAKPEQVPAKARAEYTGTLNTLPAPPGHVSTCGEGGDNCHNYPHGDNAYPTDFQTSQHVSGG